MVYFVYGPPRSGKTRNKEALRKRLGCSSVIDGLRPWKSGYFRDDSGVMHLKVPASTLVLTNMRLDELIHWVHRNAAILAPGGYSVFPVEELIGGLKHGGIDSDLAP